MFRSTSTVASKRSPHSEALASKVDPSATVLAPSATTRRRPSRFRSRIGRSVRAGGRNVVQHRMGSCHGPGHAVANQIFDDDHVSGATPPQPRDLRNDSARGDLRPSQTFPVCRTAFAFGRSCRFGLFGTFLSVGHLALGPPAIVTGDGTSLKDKDAIDRAHLVQLHLVPKQLIVMEPTQYAIPFSGCGCCDSTPFNSDAKIFPASSGWR